MVVVVGHGHASGAGGRGAQGVVATVVRACVRACVHARARAYCLARLLLQLLSLYVLYV